MSEKIETHACRYCGGIFNEKFDRNWHELGCLKNPENQEIVVRTVIKVLGGYCSPSCKHFHIIIQSPKFIKCGLFGPLKVPESGLYVKRCQECIDALEAKNRG